MSEFKPMVKMMTDEPSVSLKLKKGGKVKAKKHHKEHEEHGHKAMAHHAMGGMHNAFEAEAGKAPKKPSMMARMKAMNPQLYKKGGKVAHKVMGGGMPMANPAMPVKPMAMGALGRMDPAMRNARAMQVRKALTGMKKGGSADHKMIEKLEKELHHHESLDAKHAHPQHKAHGGKVHHMSGHPEGSMEHHKAMCKHYEKLCKDGGSAHHKKMLAHHKKMCSGGSYAKGGSASGEAIDHDETRTTIEKGVKKFAKTKMNDGEHYDHTSGKTGEVKLGHAGYKRGGKAHKYAEGGSTGNTIPSDSGKKKNATKTVMGGTLEGNEADYENTDMHTADKFSGSKTTGGVRMSNAGGFKHGGKAHHKMHHKASGGAIDKYETRTTVKGGDWENRPADGTPKGKTNTKTGEVKLANAGGYKHGGHTSKKHYATGGNVNDMGRAVKMPKHFVSLPVANSLQSGTFKTGGGVKKLAKGGRAEKEEKPNLRLISTHTGPKGHVAKVYKDKDWGEHRVRFYSPEGKHYTESDYHTDDKEDAHDTAKYALNRYKQGGKTKRYAEGDSVVDDAQTRANNKAYANWEKLQKEENEADANMIPNAIKRGVNAVKGMFGSKSPESVTKTEKSITVTPAKRRGGSMK